MTRQWVNAPGTEAHLARLEQMKALGTETARQAYVARVRSKCGDFWARYLADDFKAQREVA